MAERLTAPPRIPPKATVNEAQWRNLPPDRQAALISEFESFWRDSTPAAIPSGVRFAPLVLDTSSDLGNFVDFKGPGISREQRQEDEENQMREANRIKNQGL